MLSVVAIALNEAKNINAFVNSWSAIADEIIIVDTGSTDDSYEMVKRLECSNPKVNARKFTWTESFAEAKNHAISLASGNMVFVADLDDRLDTNSIQRIKDHLAKGGERAYRFQIASDVGNGRWSRFMQARMFPNYIKYSGRVHETPDESIIAAGIKIVDDPEVMVAHLGYADQEMKEAKARRNIGLLMKEEPKTVNEFAQLGDAFYVLGKCFNGLGFYEEACRRGGREIKEVLAEKLVIGYMATGALQKAETLLELLPTGSVSKFYWTAELRMLQRKPEQAKMLYQMVDIGERCLGDREDNCDVLISNAKKRLEEMEASCAPA